ncbi:MAG: PQQ-dependent sugar dehydrogenase [Planctomycetota bacterium]|nr:PQQ-dependent sugar dehydrogenase [Planctomycetota bacterium]
MTGRIGGWLSVLLLVLAAGGVSCSSGTARPTARPGATVKPAAAGPKVYELEDERFTVQTVLSGLDVPWSLAWLPDGAMLVAERAGRLLIVDPHGQTPRQVIRIGGVDSSGDHGLMGLALSPQFGSDRFLFLSYTTRKGDRLVSRISRFVFQVDRLFDETVLIDDLPAAGSPDGLPLRFGPVGMLCAATGDGGGGQLAQDVGSLAGKFLRINKYGRPPRDNPLALADGSRSPVWTWGHRNCQGFSWHPLTGQLYATEHGPAAGVEAILGGGDELNRIQKGRNYGWPLFHHDANGILAGARCAGPLAQWTPGVGPAGAVFYTGDKFPSLRNKLLFVALRGEALACVTFDEKNPDRVDEVSAVLERQFGRLRAVAVGPDGLIYLTTSNRDRRGVAMASDDRVLQLTPVVEKGGKMIKPKKDKKSRWGFQSPKHDM